MNKSHYIIPIFVPHEGCKHNCIFCNQNTITGSSNQVNEEFVRNTINEYLKTIPSEGSTIEVSFFGGSFTAISIEKQNELLKVAKQFKKMNKINFIRLSTRPDYIDDSILSNLKAYDVDIIELGVQSLDYDVLKKSARGHTEEDVIRASKLIKKFGFVLGHQIMIGLPEDSYEKAMKTVEKVIKLRPNIARIYPALVIKKTAMEKMYKQKLFLPYSLEYAVNVAKHVYGRLTAEGIKVIRIGLQPTKDINEGGEVIAGPFHPAFGELVEGSIVNDMVYEMISSDEYVDDVILKINPKDISKLYCNSKKYFNDMKKHFNTLNLIVIQDNTLNIGEIQLIDNKNCKKISVSEYISYKYTEGY